MHPKIHRLEFFYLGSLGVSDISNIYSPQTDTRLGIYNLQKFKVTAVSQPKPNEKSINLKLSISQICYDYEKILLFILNIITTFYHNPHISIISDKLCRK